MDREKPFLERIAPDLIIGLLGVPVGLASSTMSGWFAYHAQEPNTLFPRTLFTVILLFLLALLCLFVGGVLLVVGIQDQLSDGWQKSRARIVFAYATAFLYMLGLFSIAGVVSVANTLKCADSISGQPVFEMMFCVIPVPSLTVGDAVQLQFLLCAVFLIICLAIAGPILSRDVRDYIWPVVVTCSCSIVWFFLKYPYRNAGTPNLSYLILSVPILLVLGVIGVRAITKLRDYIRFIW